MEQNSSDRICALPGLGSYRAIRQNHRHLRSYYFIDISGQLGGSGPAWFLTIFVLGNTGSCNAIELNGIASLAPRRLHGQCRGSKGCPCRSMMSEILTQEQMVEILTKALDAAATLQRNRP
jgi:hypothetical protein